MSIVSKEVLPYLVVMTSLDEGRASHVCGIVPDCKMQVSQISDVAGLENISSAFRNKIRDSR